MKKILYTVFLIFVIFLYHILNYKWSNFSFIINSVLRKEKIPCNNVLLQQIRKSPEIAQVYYRYQYDVQYDPNEQSRLRELNGFNY